MPSSSYCSHPCGGANNSVSVQTQLRKACRVSRETVQLQQVLLNLIINAIEAMREVGAEERNCSLHP